MPSLLSSLSSPVLVEARQLTLLHFIYCLIGSLRAGRWLGKRILEH